MNVTVMDGQARKLPSLYECTLEKNTMQGYIISAARTATLSADRFWISPMQKESHTVLKSGGGYGWKHLLIQAEVMVHIIVLYARGAELAIAASGIDSIKCNSEFYRSHLIVDVTNRYCETKLFTHTNEAVRPLPIKILSINCDLRVYFEGPVVNHDSEV